MTTDGKSCILQSAYPLRAVRLNACWYPALRWVADHPGEDSSKPAGTMPAQLLPDTGRLLHRLALMGFLFEAGLPADQALPRVSVIIPVRNRPEDLERCLCALENIRYPEEQLEIIVVDDASDDDTPKIAENFDVTVLRNTSRKGASYSRNIGAGQAGGSIFCFIDSDCVADADWLRHLVFGFADERVCAVGGRVTSFLSHTFLDRYEQVNSSLDMGGYMRDSRGGGAFFYLPSCNLAVRREAFFRAGGFNEAMEVGEDVDLCWRLIDAGGVIEYLPAAKVKHRHRNRLWPFFKRRFEYGTSEPLLQAAYRNRRKRLPLWPASLILWGCITAAISLHPMLWAPAVLWMFIDSVLSRQRAQHGGMTFSLPHVFIARFRHHAGVLYHLMSFCSRYYLLLTLPLSLIFPVFFMLIAGAHTTVGIVRYVITRPKLDPMRYLFFFTLEQLAYQTGVWSGCFRQRIFSPVVPALQWRPENAT